MRSRLFECRIRHARLVPWRRPFVYRVFMLALDLDELGEVAARTRLLGINRTGLFGFREADFLPWPAPLHHPSTPPAGARDVTFPPADPPRLKQRVADFLATHGVPLAPARVELVTLPRVAGYRFNPASFYFCYDSADRPLAAIAEVTNTFGEMKPFLLNRAGWDGRAFRLRVPKHFYVSPFSAVDVAFDFRLRPVDHELVLQIDDYAGGQRTLTSVLTGRARPLCDRVLLWFFFKYPLLTLKVIAAIHWHALLLYRQKTPWFRKAARPADQRDLYYPHRSLNGTSQP